MRPVYRYAQRRIRKLSISTGATTTNAGPASHPLAARHRRRLAMLVGVRTVGVEEELLVVDPSGRPVPLGPAALEVAARRGEGETVDEHDRAEREDGDTAAVEDPAARLVPEP